MLTDDLVATGPVARRVRAPAPTPETTTRAWLAVLSLAVGAFATVTTEFLPIGLLTNIAATLGVSAGTAGLMVTIPGIAAAFAGPALIVASGRLDRRIVLVALSGLLVAANLLAAFAPNFATMLAGRMLLGLCVGGFWTFAPAATGYLVPPRLQPKAMSYVLAGISVATVAGVPAGAYLGDLVGWRAVFGVAAALSLAVLVFQVALLPAMPPTRAIKAADLLVPFKRAGARMGLAVALLLVAGHFAAYTYMKPMLLQVFGLADDGVTTALLVYGVAGLAGTVLGGQLVARSARGATLVATLAIAVVLLFVAAVGGGAITGIVVALAWGIAFGLVPIAMTGWMLEALPKAREAGQALLVTAFQVAIAGGAFTGGVVVDRFGVSSAMLLGGALAIAAAVLITTCLRKRRRRPGA